ncbi:MAG: Phage terminase small subunit [Herbinix sp.]|jgi:uncharacterized protein YjcR|nr:Phage terminase small subunit [Herbinix sp.]
MARAPDERYSKAYDMFKKGAKLIDIANQLSLPEGTVRRWKSTHKWDSERSDKKANVRKGPGAPKGNKNSVGHAPSVPEENKNAEKYGFFSKYLPPETKEIFDAVAKADPLDLLWHQIQLAYVAIVRAQQIAYVKDQSDMSKTKIQQKDGDTVTEERWEVQFAWDKQSNFMKAQARAQGELRSMIKQYDELLHNNWDKVSEEQKLRISKLRYEVSQLSGGNEGDTGIKDFLKAIKPTKEDMEALFADEVIDDEEITEE